MLMSGGGAGLRNGLGRQIPERPFAGRVLVVDDVHEDAALLAVLLGPLEANVLVAQSAKEALAIVDGQTVDLVITDLNMPGASGLDLARELRRRHDPSAVIFTTGSQCAGDKVAAFELGAVAYLQKPVAMGHLIELAREILHSRCAERDERPTSRRASGVMAISAQKRAHGVLSASAVGHSEDMSTILVVDDDIDSREIVQQVLESEGFSTIGAVDGANAMAVLKKLAEPPCLIVFDMMMPVMNGWELAAALSDDDRWTRMPRLAMSAETGDLHLGTTPILRKPFLSGQLISAVRGACSPD